MLTLREINEMRAKLDAAEEKLLDEYQGLMSTSEVAEFYGTEQYNLTCLKVFKFLTTVKKRGREEFFDRTKVHAFKTSPYYKLWSEYYKTKNR